MGHIYPDKKLCIVCQKRMGFQRRYKDFCSDKCKREFNQVFTEPAHIKTCQYCKNTFGTNRLNQIFCSTECRDANRLNSIEISKTEFSIFKRDDFTCIYCGKSSIEDGVKLVIDHITPVKLGGISVR